ncbi:MAG: type II toxin-antitoxin system VapC family toxin [Enhydrobacter sp.]|nr:MAG: type II toxin-antitoxin system VapC family toxin [Enhydrobacter sp.]
MIVVDTSALLAISFEEEGHAGFMEAVLSTDDPRLGAPNLVEASMVVETRRGERGLRELDTIVSNLGLAIVAFDASHVAAARDAFRRYGRGRHRAALNFGDCCAYALAKVLGLPLLFKGKDFTLTDIKRAL